MKNGNSIFAVLAEALEKNKKLRTILYAVLIILALAIFLTSGLFGGGKNKNKSSGRTEEEQTGEFSNTEEARMLEARLEDILSQMQNAGQVRVMVTFDNAQEKVIAADEQKSSGSSGISEASRPVKTSGSGGESPIILTERMPKIRGVIVIAEGAADISVRFSLAAASSLSSQPTSCSTSTTLTAHAPPARDSDVCSALTKTAWRCLLCAETNRYKPCGRRDGSKCRKSLKKPTSELNKEERK